MACYLGLDCSTQSLSATVIDTESGKIVCEETINFGSALPHYMCPNGFLVADDPLVVHSDPLMWVEALELLLDATSKRFELKQIKGICGSGQQHASVYLNASFETTIADYTDAPLVDQIRPCLSRATAPIWMDSSTGEECAEIARAMGGNENVCRITGSVPIERFSGAQVRKFYKNDPDGYAKTARIHLASSFLASILAGVDAAIDTGDAAGMNLLNLGTCDWDDEMLDATAPGLKSKLPSVVRQAVQVGTLSPFFGKYGFEADVPIMAWSGDNPCSLVGLGANTTGTAVISLGTSDTFFAAMAQPVTDPNGFGHVFGNPGGEFMSLICFKNGSLAREKVRDRFNLDWAAFDVALQSTPAGSHGNIMLPYFVPEITPVLLDPEVQLFGTESFEKWEEPALTVRACVEAQAMAMKHYSSWIGDAPSTIRVTGGASQSKGLVQTLADVFNAPVECLSSSNSAGLGAALLAAHVAGEVSWSRLSQAFSQAASTTQPVAANADVYADHFPRFVEKLLA